MKKKTVRDNGKILSGICFALIIEFARYLPVVALVPLTLLYLGIDETQKYTIIFLGTFFQLVLMVCDTVSGVDRNMINAPIPCTRIRRGSLSFSFINASSTSFA